MPQQELSLWGGGILVWEEESGEVSELTGVGEAWFLPWEVREVKGGLFRMSDEFSDSSGFWL